MVELARKEKVFSKVESFLLDFFNEDEINIVENTGKNPDNIWQCIYTPDCIISIFNTGGIGVSFNENSSSIYVTNITKGLCKIAPDFDTYESFVFHESGEVIWNSEKEKMKTVHFNNDEIELFNDFVDGEKMNRYYPDTFYIPLKSERESIESQTCVKVMCDFGERFWVRIVAANKCKGKKVYLGVVDNFLVTPAVSGQTIHINYGSMVFVEPKHIIDIEEESNVAA
jgi:hypothetical protein